MKTTFALTALTMVVVTSFAQVEQDDMYFNKKDRAKFNTAKEAQQAKEQEALAKAEKPLRFDYLVNTNSEENAESMTSPRNINPEYISRSQSEMAVGEEESYFLDNYQYATQNQFTNYSNNLNSWNASPLYSSNYFAPSIYGWNSPYYSPFNDPFLTGYNNNPWCNQGFRSGWSVSFSYGWGRNWNYGWNDPFMNWGMSWGNPYWNYGWGNSYWNNFYGYGNSWYPGNTIVIIDNDSRGPVYGKRGSRSQNTAYATTSSRSSSNSRSSRIASASPDNSSTTAGTGVRSTTSRTKSTEYYTPQWRRPVQQSTNSNTWESQSNTSRPQSYQNRSNSSQQRSSGSSYSAPAQRSSGSQSAPSRSGSSGGSNSSRSSRGGN